MIDDNFLLDDKENDEFYIEYLNNKDYENEEETIDFLGEEDEDDFADMSAEQKISLLF